MALPLRHLWRQGRVMASLSASAAASLLAPLLVRRRPVGGEGAGTAAEGRGSGPGPEIVARVAAVAPSLVRDYVRYCGGDPGSYDGQIPAHLFPHWCFHLAMRTMRGRPYSILRMLNAGCRLEMKGTLPAGVPFEVRARLEGIEDDGRRALLRQRLVTGVAGRGDALVAHLYEVAPSRRPAAGRRGAAQPREPRLVPPGARELARWRLGREAGLAFALLTGDFNPVHWVRPWARALGFPGTILHGFATLGKAIEGVRSALFAGAPERLRVVDARFVRPLILPADVGLYVEESAVFVGDAPGAPAYLAGSFEARSDS